MLMTQDQTQSTNDPGAARLFGTQNNREILERLEQERSLVEVTCYGVGSALLSRVGFVLPWLTLGSLPALGILLNRLKKLDQLIRVITAIVEAFETEGVEIFPRLEAPDCQSIDLFIRFPSKEFILLSIRSLGDCTVSFNEAVQALRFRWNSKNGGVRTWKPDPMDELANQELWLRRNQRDLFGGSSKDTRRPLAKVLVLSGVTKLGGMPEPMHITLGSSRFAWIRREQKGACYVISDEQIVNFITSYLAFRKAG